MGTVTLLKPDGDSEERTSPEVCLRQALEGKLKDVVVIGFREDGSFYTNTNMAYGPDTLWLLRAAERLLWQEWDRST